jgi:hypothetical protein
MVLNTIRTCAVETGPICLVSKSISCSDSRDVGTMPPRRVAVVAVSRPIRLEVAVSYNLPVTAAHAVHDAGSIRPETCDAHHSGSKCKCYKVPPHTCFMKTIWGIGLIDLPAGMVRW